MPLTTNNPISKELQKIVLPDISGEEYPHYCNTQKCLFKTPQCYEQNGDFCKTISIEGE